MPRTEREVAVEVVASTVRLGDVITVGGVPMTVLDLVDLPGGAKRLNFGRGHTLSIGPGTRLTVLRVAKGW
ncbi:hypothetical protein [Streptomyces sp. ODS28]|uniref:hypothetical protein n=1 Tax=Streptomyces sp. ODS28 TaxID=3136688 RepID=UPI0031EDEB02